MKTFYSILIAMLALFVFAPLADAKPPFWDDQVNSPARFKVLSEFGGAAVFDKETGLVWEKVAGDTDGDTDVDNNDRKTWLNAQTHCNQKPVGNRKGCGYLRFKSWRAWWTHQKVTQPFLTGIPFPMCSRPATGRLLPTPTVRATRGS